MSGPLRPAIRSHPQISVGQVRRPGGGTAALGASQQNASKHLGVLLRAGMVMRTGCAGLRDVTFSGG